MLEKLHVTGFYIAIAAAVLFLVRICALFISINRINNKIAAAGDIDRRQQLELSRKLDQVEKEFSKFFIWSLLGFILSIILIWILW